MKVSEAKTKVCPFMQNQIFLMISIDPEKYYKSQEDLLDSARLNNSANINCICGDCMAWVYTKERIEMNDLSEEEQNSRNVPSRLYTELKEDEKEGYCKRIGDV